VVTLASKTRLQLPVAVRQRIPWFARNISGLFAVLESDGSAEVWPWQPNGEDKMRQLALMLGPLSETEQATLAIAAMDKFIRLTCSEDGRTVLPSNLLFHLDAVDAEAVRIVVANQRLWMWSEARWQSLREQRVMSLDQHLSGLPQRSV
tara:strand:+ start:369 stop:815 length:447 start_codon:yes stop_codon:yes gene_type:complete